VPLLLVLLPLRGGSGAQQHGRIQLRHELLLAQMRARQVGLGLGSYRYCAAAAVADIVAVHYYFVFLALLSCLLK
jgi:hypothetical protein